MVESRVTPKISIVTAVLNRARSIERTLASVREQGYPNVEHVVVDGGSTDGTLEILERSEGIRWISEPDDGPRRRDEQGHRDGDRRLDRLAELRRLLPARRADAVAAAAESDPDVRWIVGKCRIIDADDREIRTAITAYKNWLLRHYSFRLYLTQNFVSCPSTFVRKDAYEAVGPLDPRYRISMDYDVFLRIARRWDPVVLDQELAVFRMEEGTLSIEGFEEQFAEHAEQARRHGAGHPHPGHGEPADQPRDRPGLPVAARATPASQPAPLPSRGGARPLRLVVVPQPASNPRRRAPSSRGAPGAGRAPSTGRPAGTPRPRSGGAAGGRTRTR